MAFRLSKVAKWIFSSIIRVFLFEFYILIAIKTASPDADYSSKSEATEKSI